MENQEPELEEEEVEVVLEGVPVGPSPPAWSSWNVEIHTTSKTVRMIEFRYVGFTDTNEKNLTLIYFFLLYKIAFYAKIERYRPFGCFCRHSETEGEMSYPQ